MVWVIEKEKGSSRVRLALVLTSRTNSVPALLWIGPCGRTTKLRQRARPVWNLASSRRPKNSGVTSPPFHDRE